VTVAVGNLYNVTVVPGNLYNVMVAVGDRCHAGGAVILR
jgi:hypothetical protein